MPRHWQEVSKLPITACTYIAPICHGAQNNPIDDREDMEIFEHINRKYVVAPISDPHCICPHQVYINQLVPYILAWLQRCKLNYVDQIFASRKTPRYMLLLLSVEIYHPSQHWDSWSPYKMPVQDILSIISWCQKKLLQFTYTGK